MPKKLDIARLKSFAKAKGGQCLSRVYINRAEKLKWVCDKGHIWEALANNVSRGSWCPVCAVELRASKQRSSIKEMQQIAKLRGGTCLSQKYLGAHTPINWKCKEGHVWKATPGSLVSQNSWCPYCARRAIDKKHEILDLRSLANARGGECLSKKYLDSKRKLKWSCGHGHVWRAIPSAIKSGRWCPYCAKSKIWGGPLAELDKIAKARGGVLLSKSYVNNRTKMKWKCNNDHIWMAPSDKIKMGRWCPQCAEGISERICRIYFETIFGVPFKKAHPRWLKSKSGSQLELDGYNSKLKIAFEHHGDHHFRFDKFFHKDQSSYAKRVRHDALKKVLCKQQNVKLIVIPQVTYSSNFEELKAQIYTQCKKKKIKIAKDIKNIVVPAQKIYYGRRNQQFNELKMLAQSRGGKLLSKGFLRSDSKLQWQCRLGHEWAAIPANVKYGYWCPYCSGNTVSKNIILELNQCAKKRGGSLLSKVYVNAKTKLEWRCKKGHQWRAIPNSIKNGYWCPYCAGNRILGDPLQLLKEIAISRAGKLHSTKYTNSTTKLKWECEDGHIWLAAAANIRGNSGKAPTWCPSCANAKIGNKLRTPFIVTVNIAKRRHGKC